MGAAVDIEGRTALVTGAASGIGLATARRLAAAGAHVIVSDRAGAALEAAAAELPGARAIAADLTDRGEVARLVAEAGDVQILVNNAGLQHVSPLEDFPEEAWDTILAVMLTAPFLLAKAFLPGMLEAGFGRVLNIASVHGLVASPFKSAYVSAKHGLLGLVKTLALEGAGDGITACAVCPGYVRTPLVENQVAAQAEAHGMPEARVLEEVILAPHAVKRLIEPHEVAETVAFLLGPAGAAFTGSAVSMDQGWTAR
jgi:3-hydroxybutyrate dehydrogenase